jgi:polysaccharide biosynthesis/export protein ExoF
MESIKAQRARLSEQLQFRRKQFAQLKVLYDKQFLRIDRLTEEELRIADLEEKLASLGVSLSRTDGGLVGYERDLGNLKQDRRALIDTDLMKLERDAAQLEVEIEAAGTLPRKITKPLSDADAEGPKKDALIYEIVRQDVSGPKTIPADRNALVKPGDMIVVTLQ